jgi:hypothetical protein
MSQENQSETSGPGSLHPVDGRLAEICERKVRQWEKVASGLNAGDPAKAHAEHMAAVWKRTAEKRKSPIAAISDSPTETSTEGEK